MSEAGPVSPRGEPRGAGPAIASTLARTPPRRPGAATGLLRAAGDRVAPIGRFYSFCATSLWVMVSSIPRKRFPWPEFFNQAWFVASVCILPTVLIAIPFGLVIALEVGNVARQIGATSFIGAVDAVGILREAAPIVTALLLAGAGGSAICSDLGARAIKDEVDALRVMALDPIERWVAPRVLAGLVVAVFLNGIVAFTGIMAGYVFDVLALHGTPGSFLGSFSSFANIGDVFVSELKAGIFGTLAALVAAYKGLNAKKGAAGVGTAVNQSVVMTAILLFVVNVIISQVYYAIVPPRLV
jgi:phospholipid/cholesterol/gamma-HCH transport system permease protein